MRLLAIVLFAAVLVPLLPVTARAQYGPYSYERDRDRDLSFRTRQRYQLDFEVEVRPTIRRVPEPRYYAEPAPRYYVEPDCADGVCFRGRGGNGNGYRYGGYGYEPYRGATFAVPSFAPAPNYYYREQRERGILPWRTRSYSEGYGNGYFAPRGYSRGCGPGGCP